MLQGTVALGTHFNVVFVKFDVALRVVGFLVNAIPALVATFVQKSLVKQVVPKLLHRFCVARLGGAHEIGVANIKHVPGVFERGNHGIAPRLRRHVLAFCRACNFLAVLVKACHKRNRTSFHAFVTRNDIGRNRRIRRSQMGRRIYIIDGRGK